MDHKKYQNWVSGIDELSPLQKEQTQDLLSGVTGENASLMAIEAQLEETRQCPHCKASGAVSKGMARGLRRYQCKACNKSFNAATGTALQGLHNKGKCLAFGDVNRHSTVTHYQRPNMTHPQEGGTGGEVSEILFFSAKSKRPPSLIYSMQIIPVCLSIIARRKGVSATRRGGLNRTPISLLVGHPCKLFHSLIKSFVDFPATLELTWAI